MTAKAHIKSTFSLNEQKVLLILGRRKMTIAAITEKFYDGEDRPMNDIIHVASLIRRINKKCEFYKKTWYLEGKGAGRAGRTVWRQAHKTVWRSYDKRRRDPREDKSDTRLGV